jgi:hypothetical protein
MWSSIAHQATPLKDECAAHSRPEDGSSSILDRRLPMRGSGCCRQSACIHPQVPPWALSVVIQPT